MMDRGTGTSTGQAFRYLSEAYINRGVWIRVQDHYGMRPADRYLLKKIENIVDSLKFTGFEFDSSEIRFRLNTECFIPKEYLESLKSK